jgi:PAS domain S-box-containing protein
MTEYPVESSAEVVVELNEKKRIRVLHVDDEPSLLKIAKQCLEMQGPFQVETASSAEEALEKMKKESYDAVVSDYKMPGKDGLQFLKEFRANGNGIPFIIFTGKGREEVAIQALNLGADQYVNKTGDPETVYCELAHGIGQVVEKRRIEQLLLKSEDKYRRLVENLHEGIWAIDKDSYTTFVNPRMAEILGYGREEMMGKHLFSFTDERGIELAKRLLERRQQGIKEQHDFEFIRKDGKRIYATLETSPITDDDGNYIGAIAGVMDTTERKKAEEELRENEERFRNIVENSQDVIMLTQPDGIISYLSPACSQVLGYEPAELVGKQPWIFHPDDLEKVKAVHYDALRGGKGSNLEYRVITKTGETRWISHSWSPIIADNKVKLIVSVVRDITERKKVEETMFVQRDRLETVTRSLGAGLAIISKDYRTLWANDVLKQIFGDVEGKICYLTYNQRSGICPECGVHEIFETGKVKVVHEQVGKGVDGKTVWSEITATPVKDRDGNITAALELVVPITERKRAEEELRNSEEKYRKLFDEALDAIFVADAETGILIDCNLAASELVGREKSELIGKHQRILHPPEEINGGFSASFKQHLKEREGQVLETQVITKNGEIKDVAIKANLFELQGRRTLQGIFRDITERKKTEESLRESEEKFRSIFESATDTMILLDTAGRILDVNKKAIEVYGGSKEELIGKHFTRICVGIVSPAIIPKVVKAFAEGLANKKPRLNVTIKNKKGQEIFLECSNSIIKKGDKVVATLVIARDVTERKEAEQTSKEAEEKYRSLFENSRDVTLTLDLKGKVTSINKAAVEYGFKVDELVGKNMLKFVSKRYWPKLVKDVAQIALGKTAEGRIEMQTPKGDKIAEYRSNPIFSDNRVVGIQTILEDTTEHEKAEEALRESEEKYRNLFESAMDAIVTLDLKGSITAVNNSVLRFGYEKEDLVGKNILDFVSKEYWPAVMRDFSKVAQGEPAKNEVELAVPTGKILVEYHAGAIVRENNVAGVQINIRDVTERKKSEELLRESEGRFRGLFESIQDPVGIFVGREGRLIDYNAAFKKSSGYTDEELKGKAFLDFVHPDDHAMVLEKYQTKYSEEELPLAYEIRGMNKKGESIPLELSVSTYKQKGKVIGIEVIHRDLTERKKAEQALKESEEKHRGLVELAPDGIVAVNTEGIVTSVNRSFLRLVGYDSEEGIVGKPFMELKTNRTEDIPKFQSMFKSLMKGESPSPVEFLYVRRDGTSRWAEVHPGLLIKDGKPVGAQVIMRDVSERKNTEKLNQENQQKFEQLFMSNPEAAVYVDPHERVLNVNPRFTELFRYSFDEVKGKFLDDFVVPEDRKKEALMLAQKGREEYVYHETVRKNKEGSLIPVALSSAPIVLQGQHLGDIVLYKDITERKKAEVERRETMEKVQMMNEKLRVVRSLARHDVNNKLAVVTGNVHLARKKLPVNSEVLDYLKQIEASVEQTVKIFDFAKAYEMLGVEKLAYVDVEKTVDEAVSLFPSLKDVKVMDDCHGLTVLADSLLRQLFYNLIDNSLKYGEKLSWIRVHYEEKKGGHLNVIYEDNGVGISPAAKPKLFGEGYTTGKGSGYGLYLIKRMMEVYGWTIEENGEPGKGARFVMTIPRMNTNGRDNYKID